MTDSNLSLHVARLFWMREFQVVPKILDELGCPPATIVGGLHMQWDPERDRDQGIALRTAGVPTITTSFNPTTCMDVRLFSPLTGGSDFTLGRSDMWLIKRRLKVFTEDTKAWLATMNQNLNPSMAERGDTL